MSKWTLGIIGGSGLYQIPGIEGGRWETITTPWGLPSDQVYRGKLHGVDLVFLPRHGRGHRIPPSEVNYRANIAALKSLGVTDILSLSAVGGLRADLPPGTFVVVDQFIDRTFARAKSFFGTGLVAHVSMAHPTCGRLSKALAAAARSLNIPHVLGGTYIAMEGPQFSTLAESEGFRREKYDVIGMTNMPEARLAREAELPYASLAMVTDYDCWHPSEADVDVSTVLAVMKRNTDRAIETLRALAPTLPDPALSPASRALEHALITRRDAISSDARVKLAAVIALNSLLLRLQKKRWRVLGYR